MMFQNTLNVDVWSLIFCSIFSFALKINSQELKEYCHLDVFNASCPHGNVIMMQTARYGRMRVGRCLTTSYFIGCYADVLPFMDSECSGKRFCTVKTVDSELLKFHPCRKDLMPYLEAQFTCISTQQWSSEECQNSKHITLDGPSGYISVKLGHKSHGGTADCPWQITAEVGQKIELKLFRFAYTTEKTNSITDGSNSPCRHSLVIIDGTNQREISLCSGYAREEHVFTSVHSSLQVYVQADTPGGHHRKASTLLYYKAKGCADLEEVPDADVRRTDSTAVVKCKNSLETWHLVCRDNTWIGDVRNCSRSSSTERPNKSERNVSTEFRNKVQYGILIAVSVGLILGVFLGFTLLMCMAVYKRRKRRTKDTDLETTRQNTLLCDYSDDKNQYASFLPTNQYSSFIARGAPRDDGAGDGSAPVNSSGQVTPWECSCDVSRVVPCDTQILESGTPDVIYTPRIPMEGVLATCEACRTNEILNSIYSKVPQPITSQANRNTSFMPSSQSGSNRQTSNQPVTVSYSTYDTLPSSLPKGNARCLHSVKEEDPINGNTSDYDSINSSNENKENDIEQIVSV